MKIQIKQSLAAGIAGTAVMSIIMFVGALLGMPKMSPPEMLSTMMGIPIWLGWMAHFMIGIIFASGYVYFFSKWLKRVHSRALKGALFGVAAFVIGRLAMTAMGAMSGESQMAQSSGSMTVMILAGLMGHIIFGITVALVVKEEKFVRADKQ